MKKLLLVALIGTVLVMDVFGIVKEIVTYLESQEEYDLHATVVYVE